LKLVEEISLMLDTETKWFVYSQALKRSAVIDFLFGEKEQKMKTESFEGETKEKW
jgi:hypothetical protein